MNVYRTLLVLFCLFTVCVCLLSCKRKTEDYSGLMLLANVCDASSPIAPTGLQSSGSLGHITLNWNASACLGITGYNVYRSTNAVDFIKITSSPVTTTVYDDVIASPDGDGVMYYYRVTAVVSGESDYSNVTKNVHGTRLATSYASGYTTDAGNSPYVAEGTVTVDGGNLNVADGTKLYMLDSATIDIQGDAYGSNYELVIAGLMRVLALNSAPATLTSHKSGGLADGEGFSIIFESTCIPYNTGDGSGTVIQNTTINNLRASNFAIRFDGSPRIFNCKITSNISSGGSYIEVMDGAAPIIENCSFQKNVFHLENDLTSTNFSINHNVWRGGYYSLSFFSNANFDSGDITNNDFDGTKELYVYNVTPITTLYLGGNYWNGGTGTPPLPNVNNNTAATVDFTGTLSSPPSSAGPDW